MSDSTSTKIISTLPTLPQGPSPVSDVEFSIDESGQTAQLRCADDARLSLVNLASAYGLTEVRRYRNKGWKALVVEGAASDFYRLWRRCRPSNLQDREARTRDAMLSLLESGLTKKFASLLA